MNPASEPSSEDEDGDKPRMHFGRLEDLEIFEKNKHLFTKSAVVTCSICQLYVGHPDVIREHEASHSAPVEELPDYTELYRSIREEQKQQAENVIMAKKKEKSDAWKGFLFEVFSRDPSRIHHEDFQDLEILVEVDGESIDVRRFEELMTEDGLRSASALSTTESSGLYAKTCPECSKGFVKMQDYLQHREMYHGDSPRMTESHRISGPHNEEAREEGAEGNIRRDDYFLRREWYHGDSPQATEWQENPVYKWTCTVCGKGFVNGETYTRHRSQPPCGDCRPES